MTSPAPHTKLRKHNFDIFEVPISKDPESLFCDTDFLKTYIGKTPAPAKICEETK